MERSEYYRIIHASTQGPTVSKLASLLDAMGFTWDDWALVYRQIREVTPKPRVMHHQKKHTQPRRAVSTTD